MLAAEEGVIEPKLAITTAKDEIKALFADDGVQNVGLEEISYNEAERAWDITIGFSRPWDGVHADRFEEMRARAEGRLSRFPRDYKRVLVAGDTGRVIRVLNREL